MCFCIIFWNYLYKDVYVLVFVGVVGLIGVFLEDLQCIFDKTNQWSSSFHNNCYERGLMGAVYWMYCVDFSWIYIYIICHDRTNQWSSSFHNNCYERGLMGAVYWIYCVDFSWVYIYIICHNVLPTYCLRCHVIVRLAKSFYDTTLQLPSAHTVI